MLRVNGSIAQRTTSTAGDPGPPISLSGVAITKLCGVAVILLGVLALLGWVLQVEALRTSLPGSAPVALSAALSFVLAGVALTLREHRYLRLSLAIAVMGLGVLSLTQHVLGISFGVERLVVPRDLEAMQVESGRMALSSTCAFILLGIALLQLTTRRIERRRINETIAVVVGGVALLAVTGYIYGTKELYSLSGFGSMALNTAVGFALLALGILCMRSDGIARVLPILVRALTWRVDYSPSRSWCQRCWAGLCYQPRNPVS